MSNKKPEIPTISTPTPFKVEFGEAAISDLRARLQNARFGTGGLLPAEEAFSMELHPKLSTLKEWTKEWEHLDFKKFEDDLNRFEHFMTKIDWCNLHFVHLRSSRSDAIPLMLLHGWPGSFYEFHHMIESLAEPNDPDLPAFHVVVPSLPGYCWSSPPPSKATSGVDSYSRILNALMFGLGYSKYATNGGDWGSPHSRVLGAKFSFEDGTGCRAVHLNFCPCGPAENAFTKLARLLPNSVLLSLASWTWSEEARLSLSKSLAFSTKSMAYYKIQGTRPAQLSASLIDSPVGLLSWIGHFFIAMGSSPTMTLDSVLKDVSLYWFTGCIGTSFLVYGTNPLLSELHKDPRNFIKVPFGYSAFPKELTGIVPSNWVQNTGNLRWYAKSPTGGHFAALEQPKIFVEHLRNAFSKKGKSKNFDSEILKDGAVIKGGLWDEERALEERRSKL